VEFLSIKFGKRELALNVSVISFLLFISYMHCCKSGEKSEYGKYDLMGFYVLGGKKVSVPSLLFLLSLKGKNGTICLWNQEN